MTKTLASILFAAGALIAPAQAQYCGTSVAVTLFAGKTINAGTVTVGNDGTNLYVTFNTGSTGWYLKATHLAVATSLSEIPQTRSGNPQVGRFQYQRSYDPVRTQDTYVIPIKASNWDFGTALIIAAHAEVVQTAGSTIIASETGWGNGLSFPGANWSMYFQYTVQPCAGVNPSVLWRTQTQGGWGTVARGNNPGSYRDANFVAKFPSGFYIGALAVPAMAGNSALFSSSGSVECFLPQGGTPGTLTQNYFDPRYPCADDDPNATQDPSSTTAGVLGGQAVALTLNVVFDRPGMDGDSPIPLGNLVVKAGSGTACDGMTVTQVLEAANKVLAGAPSLFSPSQINDCASRINENYVDGTTNKGYLRIP